MALQCVLVSGLSGSGKSVALGVLEDAGYYCVDNLPATLLAEALESLERGGQERVAVSVDARSAALGALPGQLERLRGRGVDCPLLFLEASTPALLRRFAETRRRHPLAADGLTLGEAIERERALLGALAELGQRLDTSELQPKMLRNWIRDLLGLGAGKPTLLFESFAYRDGIPLDADWVIDARMLPNPHYEPALRPLTGRDAPVIEFLGRQDIVAAFLRDVEQFLSRWLPEIARDNRSHVAVAIGCTGGRHRSVYLAERLAERVRGQFGRDGQVLVRHRALARGDAEAPRE